MGNITFVNNTIVLQEPPEQANATAINGTNVNATTINGANLTASMTTGNITSPEGVNATFNAGNVDYCLMKLITGSLYSSKLIE